MRVESTPSQQRDTFQPLQGSYQMSNLTKKQQTAFNSLKAAILASVAGYIFADAAAVQPFADAGLVEVNNEITNDAGAVAVRLKEDTMNQEQNPSNGAAEGQTEAGNVASNKSGFVIEDNVPMPTSTGRGRSAGMYPFEALQVGQSFFVAATADKPEPAKSLASTVSSATARYAIPATDTDGNPINEQVKVKQYQTDAAGKRERDGEGKLIVTGEGVETRAKMVETRKFQVKTVDETAQGRGPGARIWRIA